MSKNLTPEQRLRRIAEIINKGIYLLALEEGWFDNSVGRKEQKQTRVLSFGEQQIIDLCRNKARIANKDVQELFGVHRNTASRKLRKMVLRGFLIQKGNRRHTYYVTT